MAFKYEQVSDVLMRLVADMPTGARLPNRNELARSLGVARTTLEHAISELVARGVLESRMGSGTYVAERSDSLAQASTRWEALPMTIAKKTDTWAFIAPNVMHDLVPFVLRGVEDVAHANGYQLIICNTDNNSRKLEDYLYNLTLNGVSGIVVMPNVTAENNKIWNYVIESGVHVVSCYRPIVGYTTPGVYCNAHLSGFLATEHLLSRGYRRIAMIAGNLYQSVFDRYQGYRTAHMQCGIPCDSALFSCEDDADYLRRGMPNAEKFLSQGMDFDAIFAFNDRIANALYTLLRRNGLEPGRDIPIVGCDDTHICTDMTPRLSSVHFPVYDVGKAAADMLVNLCHHQPVHPYFSMVDCELIARESTSRTKAP